jgi:ribosome maturation factor RimP
MTLYCIATLLAFTSVDALRYCNRLSQVRPRSRRHALVVRLCAALDDTSVSDDDETLFEESPGILEGKFWDVLKAEAVEEAESLGLSMVSMKFGGGKLNIVASGGGVDDLAALNHHLSNWLDNEADQTVVDKLPPFILQVSSEGLSPILTSDLDFSTFKGFPVVITTSEEFKNKKGWEGLLHSRDEKHVVVNMKGRLQKIPREIVAEVRLPKSKREKGDLLERL